MQTLLLAADYRPLQVVSWERAFVLLFEGKIEIVEEYEDKVIRTVSLTLKVPSVARFLKRLVNTKRAIKFSRQNVFARDRGNCQYCGNKVRRERATYDHVLPRSQGGHTRWENIVISCVDCNQRKRDRTPEKAGMRLRTQPIKPKSLPGQPSYMLTYRKGMPIQWAQYLQDTVYWYGELESD